MSIWREMGEKKGVDTYYVLFGKMEEALRRSHACITLVKSSTQHAAAA